MRALYREKLDAGLAPRTVNYIHTTLSKALKDAVTDGLVPRNVTEGVKAPKPAKKEIHPLSPDQTGTFLDAAWGIASKPSTYWRSIADCAKANCWDSNGMI